MIPLPARILLVVVCLGVGAQCQAPCVQGLQCVSDTSYRRYTNVNCTGNPMRTIACPTTAPRCFGGSVGAPGLWSTASELDYVLVGPCLPTPNCTQSGGFHMTVDGRKDCRVYYVCSPNPNNAAAFIVTTGVCGGQMEFNAASQRCEPPASANCSVCPAGGVATPPSAPNATALATPAPPAPGNDAPRPPAPTTAPRPAAPCSGIACWLLHIQSIGQVVLNA